MIKGHRHGALASAMLLALLASGCVVGLPGATSRSITNRSRGRSRRGRAVRYALSDRPRGRLPPFPTGERVRGPAGSA